MRIGISTVGLLAPGLDDWSSARSVLQGEVAYDVESSLNLKPLSLLPANERRRTTKLIKLALQCALDAMHEQGADSKNLSSLIAKSKNLATVFSCSDGDLDIVDRIISALDMEGSPVSPTHFHNSVHNAPSGYWSIATKSHAPSTSLAVFDDIFSVGFLEAATQLICNKQDVLLVTYEVVQPVAFNNIRLITAPFASALRLTNADDVNCKFILNLSLLTEAGETSCMSDTGLEILRKGNPAARALPLLECLAKEKPATVMLPYLSGGVLKVEIELC